MKYIACDLITNHSPLPVIADRLSSVPSATVRERGFRVNLEPVARYGTGLLLLLLLAAPAGCARILDIDDAVVLDGGTDARPDGSPDASPADPVTMFREAEDFVSQELLSGGHEWVLATDVMGYSSRGYIEATPDNGARCEAAMLDNCGAVVHYDISIPTEQAYHIHFRVNPRTASNDSLHWGVDGAYVGQAASDPLFPDDWFWESRTTGVLTAGPHTIQIWMREDGQRVDIVAVSTEDTPPE